MQLIAVWVEVAMRGVAGGTVVAAEERRRLAWLAVAMTPGMGAIRTVRSMRWMGEGERVLRASLTELEASGMPAASAQFCFDGRALKAAEEELDRVRETGGQVVCFEDDVYPSALRSIYDPPPVLWVRGDAAVLEEPGIAVVGTRHPSTYGAGMAEMLSRDLAERGLVIVSGMARGVDTAAHRGALAARMRGAAGGALAARERSGAGGRTVAVWGTSIDVIYPKENKRLAEEIVAGGGAIVSEFPLGTFPAPQNFPIRNRVISGMSVGVLVIEAGEHSGTRVTARCAMEQNRDVYAVPGNVTNKNAWGPNTLIKQGAKLTATWEDVWEDLPSQVRLGLEDRMGAAESSGGETASLFGGQATGGPAMSDGERAVLGQMRADEATQLDDLMERLEGQLESPEIFAALFELELAGRVRQLPGKNYVACM